eukprot:7044180-Pyramimonas_sp.AAC.1
MGRSLAQPLGASGGHSHARRFTIAALGLNKDTQGPPRPMQEGPSPQHAPMQTHIAAHGILCAMHLIDQLAHNDMRGSTVERMHTSAYTPMQRERENES